MNRWYIPDAYWPETDNGEYVSHEAVCILNAGSEDASVSMKLYFEDRDPMEGFEITVPAQRTFHCHMDTIKNSAGEPVPRGVPYAVEVTSEADLLLQYTRVDTTQAELAIATTVIK